MRDMTMQELGLVSGGTHKNTTAERCDELHASEERARDKAMSFDAGSKQRQHFNDKADRFHEQFVKCQSEQAS